MEPSPSQSNSREQSVEDLRLAGDPRDYRTETLKERFEEKLRLASNVLLFGVGGGNDSISALMVKLQLAKDFGFAPSRLSVAAMLPDVLDYQNLTPVADLVSEIGADSKRSVGGKPISAFPEPLLAAHRGQLGVDRVLGISMRRGSEGVADALRSLLVVEKYDLVIACDVGGDFIAVKENHDVLSPMMDAYALHALRRITAESPGTELLCCVFGLGSDGESTPAMLREALARLGSYERGELDPATVSPVEGFYRTVVQLNRHSRTADFTFRSLHADPALDAPIPFKARFHTQPTPGDSKVYYGEFEHTMDRELAGKYYLFDDLTGVENPFALPCSNGIEWFLKIQNVADRVNHELNGQSYPRMEETLGEPQGAGQHSIYFGTPSRKFPSESRSAIMTDTLSSITSGVYDSALVFTEDLPPALPAGVASLPMGDKLTLLHMADNEVPVEALRRFV